jgi:hypothetical protein
MTVRRVTLTIAAAIVLLTPSRASAEGGLWEFLEKLSGPGPFHGFLLDFPVVCSVESGTVSGQAFGNQCWHPKLLPAALRATPGAGPRWSRLWSAGVYVGRFHTNDNQLTYDDPDDVVGINWVKLGVRGTWHAIDWLDVHASVDINTLTTRDPSANNFERIWLTTVSPVGFTVKPFRGSSGWRFVTFSIRPNLLVDRMNATQFGARAEPLEDGWEPSLQFGIHIDPWR